MLSLLQLIKAPYHHDQDPAYSTNKHNVIKITAATLGVLCVLIAIMMSIFMYRHYLRRQHLTLSAYQPIRKRSISSDTLLITAEAQREGQNADIEEPPSPVMQQELLQKELVRNYGSNSHPYNTTFLKPPPYHP